MEVWITFKDLENSIGDEFDKALASGHSEEAAIARAAVFLVVNRDQLIHPGVSTELTDLVLRNAKRLRET